MKKNLLSILIIILFFGLTDVFPKEIKNGNDKSLKMEERTVITDHTVTINGRSVRYYTTAGTILLKNEKDIPEASIFFIAYTKKGVEDVSKRPLTFSFNGGPGSSSVWLHLGLLGPRRVKMNSDGSLPKPPYKLIPNRFSLLDKTDIVFIDPVSTGFSRPAKKSLKKKFHGISGDISSVGEFIRLYLVKFKRWSSPKFLIGESYGTTRAAGLSGFLQNEYGIYLNGIMLVSSILNFQTTDFGIGNDLPFILFLPTYTATAYHYDKLDTEKYGTLELAVKESERFALNEYTLAMMKGDILVKSEFNSVAKKLSELTGLSQDFVKDKNLRIFAPDFYDELLKKEKKTVGRLDSRLWGYRLSSGFRRGFSFFGDPSYSAIQGPFTATFNNYVRTELNYKTDIPYEILTNKLSRWDIGKYYGRYVNVSDILGNSIVKNPYLKVFVAAGYFDFATPFFAAEYTFNHLDLPKKLRNNISFGFYKAGHMMYINEKSLIRLKSDLSKFIDSAVSE